MKQLLRILLSCLLLTASASYAGIAGITPGDAGSSLPASVRARAQALGQLLSEQALKAAQSPAAQQAAKNFSPKLKKHSDDIANAALAEQRHDVLKFLNLNPEAPDALYYFVSFSMPLDLIRSYALEAMWDGGTLVFRGVPEGMTLAQFIKKDLQKLVYGKGGASISIDPRLFDAYSVTAVPTIVFTTDRGAEHCANGHAVSFTYNKQPLSYQGCQQADPATYWKISGSITSTYALDTFIDKGAAAAKPYREALARGLSGRQASGKAQKPFAGKWKDAITPEDMMAVKAAIAAAQSSGKPVDRR